MSARGPFAELLRAARFAAALTQEELAERARLTAKAIGALERGERRRPYPHTVRALADALGLDAPTRADLLASASPSTSAPPESAATPSPTLAGPRPVPASTAPIVGRDDHLRRLTELRASGARLITLTGPGGVGKTTLALAAARAWARDFDVTAVIELAAVDDPAEVPAALARDLGIRQPGDHPLDAVARVLATRRHLVVLDNLEQVVTAAPVIGQLLERADTLVLLATSRAPLRLRGETLLVVDPLGLPADDAPDEVAASPSGVLFLDRVRAAGREVAVDATTARAVAGICRRLDGLPLALELAAAHGRLLPPAALLERLDAVLASPRSRDLPARQRTLAATLDWSHALLTAAEQQLLRRLSVLRGGFTGEAADAVTGGDAMPLLDGLVEQSLVLVDADRYRLLEPVRADAARRLQDADEVGDTLDRVTEHFVDLAQHARTGLRTREQPQWLDALEADDANLGLALEHLVDTGRGDAAARMTSQLWLSWALRGSGARALGRLAVLRERAEGLSPLGRAALAVATAGLRYAAGDGAGMAAAAESAVATVAEHADPTDPLATEALVLAGSAAVVRGHLDWAGERLRAGRAAAERTGDGWALAHVLAADGQRLVRLGLPAQAAETFAEAEAEARELACPFTLATVLNGRATADMRRGADGPAFDRLAEACRLAAAIRTPWSLAYALPRLAVLAARRGDPRLVVELAAAASAAAEVTVAYPPDPETYDRVLADARVSLGGPAFDHHGRRGREWRAADVHQLASGLDLTRARG